LKLDQIRFSVKKISISDNSASEVFKIFHRTKKITVRTKYFTKKLLDNNIIDKNNYFKLLPTATVPPRIYFLPKIHKLKNETDKLKGRPVVSTVGGPLYNLTKYMANILTKSHNNKYAIKNSYEFVSKIRNTTFPPGYCGILSSSRS
jgi:hypothetical protein